LFQLGEFAAFLGRIGAKLIDAIGALFPIIAEELIFLPEI
jgi:hypothetical protein